MARRSTRAAATVPAGQQRRFADWLGLAALVVGLLGFAVYALTRAGYEAYFDHFHVTLEEVGLSDAAVAAKSGASLAALLFLVALVTLLAYPAESSINWLIKKARESRARRRASGPPTWSAAPEPIYLLIKKVRESRARRRASGPPTWSAAPEPIYRLIEKARDRRAHRDTRASAAAREFLEAVLVAFPIAILIRLYLRTEIIRLGVGEVILALERKGNVYLFAALVLLDLAILSVARLWRTGFPRIVRAEWVWFFLAGLLGFSLLTREAVINEGRKDAGFAAQGCRLHSPLLDLRTQLVRLHAQQGDAPGTRPGAVYLRLGSDGMLVLYDLRTEQTVRVPPDSVNLISAHRPKFLTSSCPE